MTTDIQHAERAHALLGASSASRWLKCTMSPRTEEKMDNETSEYAEEGTLAHEILELKMRDYYTDNMTKGSFNVLLKGFKEHELYLPEMLRCTEDFLDYVKSVTIPMASLPHVSIEKRVDFSEYVPEGFGTADCVIVGDNALYVVDYKHGAGMKVDAYDNPQLKLYALGAYESVKAYYNIERVVLVIVQPRMYNTSEFEMTLDNLIEWGNSIKPTAAKAFSGFGEYVPGDHCGFCKAKGACEARADHYLSLEEFDEDIGLIPKKDVREIIERGKGIAAWVKSVEEYAHKELSKGIEVDGLKLVEGRGSRSFHNQDATFEYLREQGMNDSVLYEKVPLTAAKIEKLLTPKTFKALLVEGGHIKHGKGRPVIAMAEDRKPDIMKTSIEEDFG